MIEDVKIKISSEFSKQGFDSLNTSLKNTSKSLKDVESSSSKAKESFQNMGIGLQALASGAISAFIVKAVSMGAELQVLRSNFAGSIKDIELFRKATAGTVDDGSLIKLSNYASDLGVSLNDQAKLFSLAEDAADKYGGGVESNFEKIINASDGSARGLRAVGISVNAFNDELAKLISTSGKHLDTMDAEEQQNIRLQAIFNLTGTTIESVSNKVKDSKDKMDSLQVTVTNLTSALGEGMVDGINAMINGFSKLIPALNVTGVSFDEFFKILGRGAFMSTIPNMINNITIAIDTLQNKMKSAELSTRSFQDGGSEDVIQFDKYGNVIMPKSPIAENTNYTNGKNLGYNPANIKDGHGSELNKDVKNKIESAKAFYPPGGGVLIFDTSGIVLPGKLIGGLTSESIRQTGFQVESDAIAGMTAKEARNTLEDTQTMYTVVSSTMNLLGVSTESFVGKIVGGFGTVLTIMESIKTVNSIFSFIPGFADGGIMPGVSWVGERGKELMFNPGAYIMNHSDSMKFVNSNSSNPNVNVYLSGNIDLKAQLRKDNKKYKAITIKQ